MPAEGGSSGRHAWAVRPRRPWRYWARWAAFVVLVGATAILLGACGFVSGDAQDTLDVKGDYNQKVLSVYTLVFWIAAAVFVIVEGVLVYSMIRYRRRPGDKLPPQIHGNNRLEIAWTIAPALLLVIVAVPTLQTIRSTETIPAAGPNVLEVQVIGHQWWWEVQYPGQNVTTANEIHLPLGKTAVFRLTSGDVQHSFWIPKMAGKMDVLPTRTNYLSFTPQEVGEYHGQCVELCGTSHANMRLRLIVDTPADFDAWVAAHQQPAVASTDPLAKQGQAVFLRSPCVACHTIAGTTAQGKIGPDLSHIGSRTTIAAGVLDNTPANMKLWIEDPAAIKPGIVPALRPTYFMPAFKDSLKPEDLNALVAYLESLK